MKSIIPKMLSHFWTHVLIVVVIFHHSECAVSYGDDAIFEALPTYCCSDFDDAVLDICGEYNYDVDWYSGDGQDCCLIGCSDWALSQLCITPVEPIPLPVYCCDDLEIAVAQVCGEDNYYIDQYSHPARHCCDYGCSDWGLRKFCIYPPVYPEPTLPTYCCDDLEEAVSDLCGEDNYYPIDFYSPEAQGCCYFGCDEDDLSLFCIDYTIINDPASSLMPTSSENPMEETDPSLMNADSEELMETTDQSPTKTTTSSLMSTQTENYAEITDPTPTTP
ncbi:uncharacterized protein LOC117180231 [Belonocnema kinseyi]|uniref:uncharacterized protein LOC117180231 n=1 Tax=Belonocnema kinseyi TaxID=2817044 RepID=UPI00143DC9A9|nr:uncharacterized protein LOC117180231 [Belonocnema kinseyi]